MHSLGKGGPFAHSASSKFSVIDLINNLFHQAHQSTEKLIILAGIFTKTHTQPISMENTYWFAHTSPAKYQINKLLIAVDRTMLQTEYMRCVGSELF